MKIISHVPAARGWVLQQVRAAVRLAREFLRFLRFNLSFSVGAGLGVALAAAPAPARAAADSLVPAGFARGLDASALGDAALGEALAEPMRRASWLAPTAEPARQWFAAVPTEWSRLDAQPGEPGARIDTAGAVFGFSWHPTRAPRLTLAGGVFDQEGRIGERALRFDQLGFGLALVGERNFGPWALRASAGATALQLKTRRTAGSGASAGAVRVSGKTDGVSHHARLAVERTLRFEATEVTFTGGVRSHVSEYDAFAETGPAGETRRLGGLARDSVRGFLGARIEGQGWELGRLRLRFSSVVQLEHELADRSVEVSAATGATTTRGAASAGRRVHLVGEPRLVWWADNGITATIGYRAELDGRDFAQHGLRLNVSRRF